MDEALSLLNRAERRCPTMLAALAELTFIKDRPADRHTERRFCLPIYLYTSCLGSPLSAVSRRLVNQDMF